MSADEIEQLASLWLAREDRGLSAAEQDALAQWLSASSLNRVAYLRLKSAWQRSERLAALKRPPMREPVPVGTWSRLRVPVLAAAMVLALLGAGWVWMQPGNGEGQVFATGVGQIQAYQLADGTRMELNTNTRLRATVTARTRIVTLDYGEAYFDVTHDARHPFTVQAGNRRITDLGTKFSVLRNDENLRVLVREGKVQVAMQPGQAGPAPIVAEAGHAVIAQGAETMVFAKPQREIDGDLGWRGGMLVFDQLPLTRVAEEFNRYNTKHIEVEGNARKIRIGGSFKADNVDGFLQLLRQGFGLSVNDRGDRIVVSR